MFFQIWKEDVIVELQKIVMKQLGVLTSTEVLVGDDLQSSLTTELGMHVIFDLIVVGVVRSVKGVVVVKHLTITRPFDDLVLNF